MAKILFGTGQINNPTPAHINRIARVFTIVAGVFLAWMSTSNLIGPNSKDIIGQILGLLLGIVNGLAPMFGVQVSGDIPVADVKSIETK